MYGVLSGKYINAVVHIRAARQKTVQNATIAAIILAIPFPADVSAKTSASRS
jgi:hypothetical protein